METSPKTVDIYDVDHLYAVASMYYNEELSQSEIAHRMKVSRPTISRMLSHARETGMVSIKVTHPNADNNDALAKRLQETLGLSKVYLAQGLQDATVGPGMEPPVLDALRDMHLTRGSALVVSSGMAMYGVANMNLPALSGVTLVPAVGGVAEPEPWHQSNEIIRTIAQNTGATYKPIFSRAIPAPLMYQALQEDQLFQEIVDLWSHAQGALLGIGSPTTGRTSLASDIPQSELKESRGDIALHFFDAEGQPLAYSGSERTIRIPLERLKAIPHSVAVAVGPEKVESIIISAGMRAYRKLVTDEATAKLILKELDSA